MKYQYHIAVIGGGSAGLVVASGAASLGAKVVLVERSKMGGDCLNSGCVPSKAFLRAAHLASEIRSSAQYGINGEVKEIDIKKVMKYVRSVIDAIEPHDSAERFKGMGVDVINEEATFKDPHTLIVGKKTVTAENIVIATGSTASVPAIPGLREADFYTNENIFNLKKLPDKLIVLGGGPIGLEIGQGFLHLGSSVHIIDMLDNLFSKDDPEVAPYMQRLLTDEGIRLHLSSNVISVSQDKKKISVNIEQMGKKSEIKGDALFLALGRKPVTENLGLEYAGVKTDSRGYVKVNGFLQTSVKNIYACGDIVGSYQFTHMASYQAGVVLRNIVFPLKKSPINYSAVTWTTFTKPEISHVGQTEQMAKSSGKFRDSIFIELEEVDRARTDNDLKGFLKVILGRKNRIIGATMMGNRAGDIIPLAGMAINNKYKATGFMSMVFPYPSESEIMKFASLSAAKKSFKPWMKNLVKSIAFR